MVVDAASAGLEIVEAEAKDIARCGVAISDAANEQFGFTHPGFPDWGHISFCAFCGVLSQPGTGRQGNQLWPSSRARWIACQPVLQSLPAWR
nr:proline racemase family protein [Octadecabacter ascidiaceicola]